MKRNYQTPKADIMVLPRTAILEEVSTGPSVPNVGGDAPARKSYSPPMPQVKL